MKALVRCARVDLAGGSPGKEVRGASLAPNYCIIDLQTEDCIDVVVDCIDVVVDCIEVVVDCIDVVIDCIDVAVDCIDVVVYT